jgi:hypothetical protein
VDALCRWQIRARTGATAGAATAGTVIALLTVFAIVNVAFDMKPARDLPPGCEQPGLDILAFYIPLVAWTPLLFLVTRDYHRRRTAAAP